MNSRSQIRCYKHAFVLQRYFRTFAANPSDSISDVVIQMHFLSLYKGRICVYSTRTDFKRNSYTNSYTYSYTRFSALGKIYKILKIGHSDSYRQDFKVAGSIKFRIFNCSKLQNSYTYSDTKIPSKYEKTAIEASLLRFFCGVTGNRTRDTRIFSNKLINSESTVYQLDNCTFFFYG